MTFERGHRRTPSDFRKDMLIQQYVSLATEDSLGGEHVLWLGDVSGQRANRVGVMRSRLEAGVGRRRTPPVSRDCVGGPS